MAKLIVAKDVLECYENGQSTCLIEANTIITPAAKDEAKKYGISFEVDCPKCEKANINFKKGNEMSSDDLLSLLKTLLNTVDKEDKPSLPYRCVAHHNGLKVVKGGTVRMDEFDTGNPDDKVTYQELVSKDESKMSAGFLSIDHSNFAWKLPYEEIDYVISGTVSVEIDGQTYVGRAGDVLYVPKGSDVVWGSPDHAKIFYTTFPANWSDLM
ncbi:cupin domain-containing protein [Streptococcus hongkongensis]|nr:ethanolamine utilization protein EutQ [Streptococcus uberis]